MTPPSRPVVRASARCGAAPPRSPRARARAPRRAPGTGSRPPPGARSTATSMTTQAGPTGASPCSKMPPPSLTITGPPEYSSSSRVRPVVVPRSCRVAAAVARIRRCTASLYSGSIPGSPSHCAIHRTISGGVSLRSARWARLSACASERAGLLLEDGHEADEEVLRHHPQRELAQQPVLVAAHRTTTRCSADRNRVCGSSTIDSRPPPMRRPVRRSYSNSWSSSTDSDALDGLDHLRDGGRGQRGVERPAGAVGAAGQRVHEAGQRVDDPLPHHRGGPAGQRADQRRDADALVVRRAQLDRHADHPPHVEGRPDRRRAARWTARSRRACAGAGRCAAGARRAPGPPTTPLSAAGRHRARATSIGRLAGDGLEVRRGDGPLPGAQRQRPAHLGLLRRSRRRPRPSRAPGWSPTRRTAARCAAR